MTYRLTKKAILTIYRSFLITILIGIIITTYALFMIGKAKWEIVQTLDEWNDNMSSNVIYVEGNYPDLDFNEGEAIGKLTILDNEELPVVTGVEDSSLELGVLHYSETPFPGEDGNSILLGHRDGIFKDLKHVKMDQVFTIETVYGVDTYEVIDIKILKPNDYSVFDYYGFPTVSLETCYPFSYIGNAPERYIVVGKKIEIAH